MKTKTPTIEAPQGALTTFEQELARINEDRARLLRQCEESQRKLTTLADRARVRLEQEQSAQTAIDVARTALAEAQVRHEFLTSSELVKASEANLSSLQKHLSAAHDQQMKLLNRQQQEADADTRKETALHDAIERAHVTLAHLSEREQIICKPQAQATTEQGERAFRTCLDTLRAMEAKRDIERSTLSRMEEEIAAYIHQASAELAPFPEQQAAFSQAFVFTDPLTGLLQAQIDFIGLVLATGQGVEMPLEVSSKANLRYMGLPDRLSIESAHFLPALQAEHSKPPARLLERRDLLNQLLVLYRKSK